MTSQAPPETSESHRSAAVRDEAPLRDFEPRAARVNRNVARRVVSCSSCEGPLDYPFAYQYCQHVVCASCAQGRRDKIYCPPCVAKYGDTRLRLRTMECSQFSELLRSSVGSQWLEDKRYKLSNQNRPALIEATEMRPVFRSSVETLEQRSFARKKKGKGKSRRRGRGHDSDDSDESSSSSDDDEDSEEGQFCMTLCCPLRLGTLCVGRLLCPRKERRCYGCLERNVKRIIISITAIILFIWFLTFVNYALSGHSDLSNLVPYFLVKRNTSLNEL